MVLLFIVLMVTLAENISFEQSHLVLWNWFGVTLPMDEESFKRKLTHLTASDKLGLIKEALVRVWSSVLFNWKPEDVYQAIFELYTVVDGIDLNTQPSTPSKTGRVDIAPEDALLQHWTGTPRATSCGRGFGTMNDSSPTAFIQSRFYLYRAAGRASHDWPVRLERSFLDQLRYQEGLE
jgi:hypothetical protein